MFTFSVPHVFLIFDFHFMCPNIIFHLHVPSHCCGFAVCLLEWAQWVCSHGLARRFGLGCFQAVFRLISFLCCGPLSPLSGSSIICQSVMRDTEWNKKLKHQKACTNYYMRQKYKNISPLLFVTLCLSCMIFVYILDIHNISYTMFWLTQITGVVHKHQRWKKGTTVFSTTYRP